MGEGDDTLLYLLGSGWGGEKLSTGGVNLHLSNRLGEHPGGGRGPLHRHAPDEAVADEQFGFTCQHTVAYFHAEPAVDFTPRPIGGDDTRTEMENEFEMLSIFIACAG